MSFISSSSNGTWNDLKLMEGYKTEGSMCCSDVNVVLNVSAVNLLLTSKTSAIPTNVQPQKNL